MSTGGAAKDNDAAVVQNVEDLKAAQDGTGETTEENTGKISHEEMLSEMADLKSYESHDKKGDLIMTDPNPGGDGDGYDVSAALRNVLREKISKLSAKKFSLKPALAYGFTEDEIFTNYLRWSQKEEDVKTNTFNVDKAFRRLAGLGDFFIQYAELLSEPLDEQSALETLALVGLMPPKNRDHPPRDADGRLIMMASFKDLKMLEPETKKSLLVKQAHGTLHDEFVRAYTWSTLKAMKDPSTSRQGAIVLCDYGFMGMSEASAMQTLFGKKLKKALGKLFHGTSSLKMKHIIMLNCPWWMRMMMAFARIFVSGKIMSRMHIMGDKHVKLASYLGGPEYIPEAYFD